MYLLLRCSPLMCTRHSTPPFGSQNSSTEESSLFGASITIFAVWAGVDLETVRPDWVEFPQRCSALDTSFWPRDGKSVLLCFFRRQSQVRKGVCQVSPRSSPAPSSKFLTVRERMAVPLDSPRPTPYRVERIPHGRVQLLLPIQALCK